MHRVVLACTAVVPDMVRVSLQRTRKWTPLMIAAHKGVMEDVVLLISAGADVIKRDRVRPHM